MIDYVIRRFFLLRMIPMHTLEQFIFLHFSNQFEKSKIHHHHAISNISKVNLRSGNNKKLVLY